MTGRAMAARSDETGTGSAEGNSAVANGDGPQITGDYSMTDIFKSEPVPATNQAGEVERLRQELFAMTAWKNRLVDAFERSEQWVSDLLSWKAEASAALATQPATSQEGEAVTLLRTMVEHFDAHGVPPEVADHYRAADRLLAATPTPPTLSEDLRELERLREDVAFLLARSGQAGKFTFGGKRWTGVSSNALVSIAFGEADEGLPSDSSDLAACYRAVMRLPMHRRTDAVFDHLEAGERHVEGKYQGSIEWAREDSEWPGRAALAQAKAS